MSQFNKHHKTINTKDEWFTPQEIIKSLGEFDLDPCTNINRPWNTAKEHFTLPKLVGDCGLVKSWYGRVWLNPPYSSAKKWMEKLSNHNNGIALIFARTETKMFFDYVWNKADAILFIKGRLSFYNLDGTIAKFNSGAPSCLIAYNRENALMLQQSNIEGKFINLKQ